MTTSHTPTLWHASVNQNRPSDVTIFASPGRSGPIAEIVNAGPDLALANAAHIVLCVNAHDDLLAALIELEDVLGRMNESGDCGHNARLSRARAAIAKATS